MLPAQLLEWNRTEADYPRASTIAEVFSAQAARTPDAIALISHGRSLTYRQLDESANRLARHLQGLGVKPDTLVGVAMGRSETLVVSLLAILKAGGAYVPLDPTYPQDRLSLVIEDSEMPVLLTTADSRAHLPLASGSLTVLDAEDPVHRPRKPAARRLRRHARKPRLRHLHLRLHGKAQRRDGREPQRGEFFHRHGSGVRLRGWLRARRLAGRHQRVL